MIKNKIWEASHFVISHVLSSVLSNGYAPFFTYISKHKEKSTIFLPLPFFHKPQVILGFLCLETILRHLCLSYIHPTLCAFSSMYVFYLLWLNLGLLELPYWWILRYHIHPFFPSLVPFANIESRLCFRDLLISSIFKS